MTRHRFLFFILVIFVALGTGCDSANELGSISEDIDVPDVVSGAARDYIQSIFDEYVGVMPENGYIDWKIESLEYSYTYEDIDGMEVVIYRMNYEFLSETPENIIMAGGMYMTDDNWVMPGYPNSTFLIFQQEEDSLSYISAIMVNDSTPGEETFTSDMLNVIGQVK